MLVEMKIKGLAIDPGNKAPVVLLGDLEDKFTVPIWIGMLEASAIAMVLEKIEAPRPMTHDLMHNMLTQMNAEIERIVIHELKDSTFFAKIHIRINDQKQVVDARPSDSMALALRAGCSIWMDDSVIEQAAITEDEMKDGEKMNQSAEKKELAEMTFADFPNKYKM